jgi:5-methylcytosine-specific restriction endonuclease McrA
MPRVNYKEDKCCIMCGRSDVKLVFHHRDPATKSFHIGSWGYLKLKDIEEIAKCDLLCYGCHRRVHNKIGTQAAPRNHYPSLDCGTV